MTSMPHHSITFFVDDEPYQTEAKTLTVRQILLMSGNEPPEQFSLYHKDGEGTPNKYEGLDGEVHLHEGMRFTPLYCGETPYSDGEILFGAVRMQKDLLAVGIHAEGPFLGQNGEQLLFISSYPIHLGRWFGREVSLGVPVGPDFPATLPRGLFVTPGLIPPGAFNINDPGGSTAALPGAGWLYWSRPMPSNRWNPQHPGLSLIRHWDTVFADERFYAA